MNQNVQKSKQVLAPAVGIKGPGGIDQLTVFTREVRSPGEGEVRIRVKAAAVNPTDLLLRNAGIAGISRADGKVPPKPSRPVPPGHDPELPPPWTPGMEAAGIVEAIGPGVTHLQPGDEVMTVVGPRRPEGGAQAAMLIAPAVSTVRAPRNLSLDEAAAIPMNGLTAMLGLDLLGLRPGDRLAVTGGAGMLASYVIPMAREQGLQVLADAAPADEAQVRGLGADPVVPRGDGFADSVRQAWPEGAHGVFDTALLLDKVLNALADGGGLATVRGWNPDGLPRGIRQVPVWVVRAMQRTDWLENLRELAEKGVLRPRIAGRFPPDQVAEAHRRIGEGGVRGRFIITF